MGTAAAPSSGATSGAGCTDPRFREAEQAAYNALLEARAAAARELEQTITDLVQTCNKDLAKEDDRYRQALLKCGGAGECNKTQEDYHASRTVHFLSVRDRDIYFARTKEAEARDRAKKAYDQAVAAARRRLCPPDEPSSSADAATRAAERQRVQQALSRIAFYVATIH
jgi:hypothetical protein